MSASRLTYRPVRRENWEDLEELFESRGGPGYCWCMVWREMEKGMSRDSKADKKRIMRSLVEGGTPIGLLGYDGSDPVAWCSIAPRDTYRSLGGIESEKPVWSLACFYIKRDYRKRGLSGHLLEEAIDYAASNGAACLEAYPVAPESPSYRFMGFVSLFEDRGFRFVKKAGKRRNVMILDL